MVLNNSSLLFYVCKRSVLFADALCVGTGTGVNFDDITFVDEKRNLDFVTIIDFRRFGYIWPCESREEASEGK